LDDLLANLEQKSDTASWVVKPDQLFGKRGKLGLLGISLTSEEVVSWIKDHWHKETEIDTSTGVLHTFLVEPFVPHEKEWYIAIKTNRDGDVLHFSHEGGIEVEENWDTVISLHIPVLETLEEATIIETFGELPKAVVSFVHDLF
jgi:succinyl-CoA synthetase beta subunit